MPVSDSNAALDSELARIARPVLVISTAVGRGMFSIGEALIERLGDGAIHHAVEEFLPARAMREDVERYQWISNRAPWLLNIPYRVPWIYRRKLRREQRAEVTDLTRLQDAIQGSGARTVICVSHRPAFWVSCAKARGRLEVAVVGLLGEFGPNLGWRYQFWPQIDEFWSPVPEDQVGFAVDPHVRLRVIELPVRREYEALATRPGDRRHVLLVCGYWGQGPFVRVLRSLLGTASNVRVTVVCGENAAARAACAAFGDRVITHGEVESLAPLLAEAGVVVSKPGISTVLEAHAARRKLLLLRGMPVAEDNNARHAIAHFGAEWYSPAAYRRWLASAAD